MGSFDFLDPTAPFKTDLGIIGGAVDPMGVFTGSGLAGGDFGETGQMLADPLDIFGIRAGQTRDEVGNILRSSAEQGIQSQRDMIDRIDALFKPYQEAAAQGLTDFTSLAAGGEFTAPTSPAYGYELEQGSRAANRLAAAQGRYNSSKRQADIADVALNAGQNELARQYGGQLDLQRLGTNALSALGGAGQNAGQAAGSIYGNLGQGVNSALQAYGASRQQSLNQGANALGGLSQYLAQKGY